MKKPEGKFAWTVKVGEKGQFVIPKEARDIFNIHPGDTLIVLADINKGIAIPPKNTFSELANKIFEGNVIEEDDDNVEK
ncbi:MAG: AbrB/MazE/SpoVT family DNA-binding domain-containing protein [Oscillospiraceae bacterium]